MSLQGEISHYQRLIISLVMCIYHEYISAIIICAELINVGLTITTGHSSRYSYLHIYYRDLSFMQIQIRTWI